MNFEVALRATEILMAVAFILQSAEHLSKPMDGRWIFLIRLCLSVALLCGLQPGWSLLGLVLVSLVILHRFQGPYNGGSDRMSVLILWCVALTHTMPTAAWQEVTFGYLAVQLTLSYFISGKVKLVNPEWRSGRALRDVFDFSAYPVSEGLRRLANRPQLLWIMSWAVILFEIFFPLALLNQTALIAALVIGAAFHFSNACFFGLNRFFWIWLAAYPSLIWLQSRLLPTTM